MCRCSTREAARRAFAPRLCCLTHGLATLDDDLGGGDARGAVGRPGPRVRDWATFGLGSQIDRDDTQVRDALMARLEDPDEDTRVEALRGLAARGDERATPPLLVELDGPKGFQDPDDAVDEALLAFAARGDTRFCRYVEARRRSWEVGRPEEPLPDDLQRAVDACRRHGGGSSERIVARGA